VDHPGFNKRHSHLALVCKENNIPMIVAPALLKEGFSADFLIINGREKKVFIDPNSDFIDRYRNLYIKEQQMQALFDFTARADSVSEDDIDFRIGANIRHPDDIRDLKGKVSSIDLWRTEDLFLNSSVEPREQDLTVMVETACEYTSQLNGGQGSLIIRMFDFSKDRIRKKNGDFQSIPKFLKDRIGNEPNSVYGLDFLQDPKNEDLVKIFIRSVLKGSFKHQNATLIIPQCKTKKDFTWFSALVEECKEELTREKQDFYSDIPLGIMVETKEAIEFITKKEEELKNLGIQQINIGTNDLLESLGENFAHLFNTTQRIAMLAEKQEISCSLCGSMASHPQRALALIPLIPVKPKHTFPLCFSVDRFKIGEIKSIFRGVSVSRLKETPVANELKNSIKKGKKWLENKLLEEHIDRLWRSEESRIEAKKLETLKDELYSLEVSERQALLDERERELREKTDALAREKAILRLFNLNTQMGSEVQIIFDRNRGNDRQRALGLRTFFDEYLSELKALPLSRRSWDVTLPTIERLEGMSENTFYVLLNRLELYAILPCDHIVSHYVEGHYCFAFGGPYAEVYSPYYMGAGDTSNNTVTLNPFQHGDTRNTHPIPANNNVVAESGIAWIKNDCYVPRLARRLEGIDMNAAAVLLQGDHEHLDQWDDVIYADSTTRQVIGVYRQDPEDNHNGILFLWNSPHIISRIEGITLSDIQQSETQETLITLFNQAWRQAEMIARYQKRIQEASTKTTNRSRFNNAIRFVKNAMG